MVLLAIPLGLLALWLLTTASALNSQNQAQANKDFWTWLAAGFISPITWGVKQSVYYAKVIAKWMYPGLKFAEKQVAGYFIGLSNYDLYNGRQRHRMIVALSNVQAWADKTLRREVTNESLALSRAWTTHFFTTKAPSAPQRKINQRDVDVAFQRLIEANFVKHLKQDFPKFEWDKDQWKKWLGVLPALGGAVVTQPHQAPQPQPQPSPKPSPNPAENPATQPTTLPHTDDNPNPEPGTQIIPAVVSGKDRWARGQITQLRKLEENTRRHLGPLALLALTPFAIKTLVGLLECKNFGRFQRGICRLPTNTFNNLLGLLLDVLILADICEVMKLAQQGFGLVEGPLSTFIGDVGGALCHGDYDAPPAMTGPAVYEWAPSLIAA